MPLSGSTGRVFQPLYDPSTRSGVVFGVVLMTVPFLALLNQGVRLGTATRRRRYDALAVVGATRSDLRRCAALEVGAPGTAGAILGIGVYWLLRLVLGSGLEDNAIGALVPTQVGPGSGPSRSSSSCRHLPSSPEPGLCVVAAHRPCVARPSQEAGCWCSWPGRC